MVGNRSDEGGVNQLGIGLNLPDKDQPGKLTQGRLTTTPFHDEPESNQTS